MIVHPLQAVATRAGMLGPSDADARFDPARVTGLRLVVDRTAGGCLWISDVGLLVLR